MLRLIVALLIVFGIPSTAIASQSLRPDCFGPFDLCGYVDINGQILIPARFEKAQRFSDGLAAVRIDGDWGFVDVRGSVVIQPQFDAVGRFYGDRAEAVINGLHGVIDREGDFVLTPRFARAIPFTRDVSLIREVSGEPKPFQLEHLASDFLSKDYYLFNHKEGRVTSQPRKFNWFHHSNSKSNARYIWATDDAVSDLYGLMDASGSWVIEPMFGVTQSLHQNRAIVRGPQFGDLWGAVDEKGQIAIPLTYHWLSFFENDYAIIGSEGPYNQRKHGLLRLDGSTLVEPIFDIARRDENGEPPRVRKDGVWYQVNADGSLVLHPDETLISSCPQGLRVERRDGQFYLTDRKGYPSFDQPANYVEFGVRNKDGSISLDQIDSKQLDCTAPIPVGFGSTSSDTPQYTYVRPSGEPLFEPVQFFANAQMFFEGFGVVGTAQSVSEGDWGVVDADGQIVRPMAPGFLQVQRKLSIALEQTIFVKLMPGNGGSVEYVDAYGRQLLGVEERIDALERERVLTCAAGVSIVGDGDRFGLIASDGSEMVTASHRAITCYRNGVAWAPKDELRAWCPVGQDGQFRAKPQCWPELYTTIVTHHVPEEFSTDPYENSVLWVRANLRYGMNLREEPPKWIPDGVQSQVSHSVIPFRP